MKIIRYILILLILLTISLHGVNIYYSNNVSADSIEATKLQEAINNLEEENTILKTEILKYTSYEQVSSRAAELGFVEPKEYMSLYTPNKVAHR
jgi:cell division protein FtsB